MRRVQTKICRFFEMYSLRHTTSQKYTDGRPYLDLPEKKEVVVSVEFTAREQKLYDHALQEAVAALRGRGFYGWWPQWKKAADHMRLLASNFRNAPRLEVNIDAPLLGFGGGERGWGNREANEADGGAPALSVSVDEALEKHVPRFAAGMQADLRASLEKPGAEFECPICFEPPGMAFGLTVCGHLFCKGCIAAHADTDGCPLCRQRVLSTSLVFIRPRDAEVREESLHLSQEAVNQVRLAGDPGPDAPLEDQFRFVSSQPSAKIVAMLERLQTLRTEDPQAKVVIFTQNKGTIAAVESALGGAGHQFRTMRGHLTQKQRSAAIADFAENENVVAFISTLRSGACGLNLTCANHVFLMDPALNPAQELQAIGRCHRIAQTKPVTAHRFIVKKTIEEVCLRRAPVQLCPRPCLRQAAGRPRGADLLHPTAGLAAPTAPSDTSLDRSFMKHRAAAEGGASAS